MPTANAPTQAVIDLSALARNLSAIRRRLPQRCEILAVIKADAYGHGALGIATALLTQGITRFAVASVEEGVRLREAGVTVPIVVMGPIFAEQGETLITWRLTPVVSDDALVPELLLALRGHPTPYHVHIKVETGMGRLGFAPDAAVALLHSEPFKRALVAEGIMTHLADADNADQTFTFRQIERLQAVLSGLTPYGFNIPLVHAANSAAIIANPQTHLTLVRPGLMLYGYASAQQHALASDLEPILSLTTKVAQIRQLAAGDTVSYGRTFKSLRPSRIAVLPLGYADGYNRHLSNRGIVLIRGRRASIVGRVCMDMTMVDVTGIPEARAGDSVVVIGQQGHDRITASDVAGWLDTIPYEVLCNIGPRIPRVYVESGLSWDRDQRAGDSAAGG